MELAGAAPPQPPESNVPPPHMLPQSLVESLTVVEAEREIAEYCAQMEADFQRKVAESSGDSSANVKHLEQETNMKIEQLKQHAANISSEVIQMLLRHATTVKN